MTLMPLILPLGDRFLLIRFAESLDDAANRRAIAFSRQMETEPPPGVEEVVPNLISVLLRYDPARIGFEKLAGEVRVRLMLCENQSEPHPDKVHDISVRYGGGEGPDLDSVAAASGLDAPGFIAWHTAHPLRVLAIGFAPGFVYCGFHEGLPLLPRRNEVRPVVPPGTILFAAGQTAMTATPLPTGWNVIGRTTFRAFDAAAQPPVRLAPGDSVRFVAQ